jgi:hypothetical protein
MGNSPTRARPGSRRIDVRNKTGRSTVAGTVTVVSFEDGEGKEVPLPGGLRHLLSQVRTA